jgi:hypothetical protein
MHTFSVNAVCIFSTNISVSKAGTFAAGYWERLTLRFVVANNLLQI